MKGSEQLELQPGCLVLLPFLPAFLLLLLPAPAAVRGWLRQRTQTGTWTRGLLAPLAVSWCSPLPPCLSDSHSSADVFSTSFPKEKGPSCPAALALRPRTCLLPGTARWEQPGSAGLCWAQPFPSQQLRVLQTTQGLWQQSPSSLGSVPSACSPGSWGILAAQLPSAPREVFAARCREVDSVVPAPQTPLPTLSCRCWRSTKGAEQ